MSRVLFVAPTYITEDTRTAWKMHCDSMSRQTGDWFHVVVDDASPEPIGYDCSDSSRWAIIRNEQNVGSPLAAAMKGIKEYGKPDDIVAIVDGDDWLLVDNVPDILNEAYADGTEVAWTNFLRSDGMPGWCKMFPATVHPRDQWNSSHLKTFRLSVLDRIDDGLLRNGDGNYVRFAGDCALYWALLEKCYKRKHIPRLVYCYNVGNPLSERRKNEKKVGETTKLLHERKQHTRGQPTKRGVIDTGRVCNEKCDFCYYAHEEGKKEFVPVEVLKEQATKLAKAGRIAIDLTGGEPSIHPGIRELIDHIHGLGLKVCMISNGLKGFDFGCDDYLVSLHGTKETHDKSVKKDGAYATLMQGIDWLKKAGKSFRFNCVINQRNIAELPAIAEIMRDCGPRICNFINFNPYYGWSTGFTTDIMASYTSFRDNLKEAIDILTKDGIGVNVRYLPFCQLKGYERHIVGIMQHVFDQYEWLECDMSTEQAVERAHSIRIRNNNINNRACDLCGMQLVCDGPNKTYCDENGIKELEPYVNMPQVMPYDVYAWRIQYDEVHEY